MDVKQTTFHTHRIREGYDTDEVDEFMDTVADTISRLASQVQALREIQGDNRTIHHQT